MKTFNRICIKTTEFEDEDRSITLKRGEEYTTSKEKNGQVKVFTRYWFWAPIEIFAGEERFT